ncbi:hypothetical protein ED867_20820, partial [Acinetobacter baumannii]
DRNQFITNFANVHNARQALVRAISEKAKEIAETAKAHRDDRNQFITNFANVHNARQALVRAISEKAKEIAET